MSVTQLSVFLNDEVGRLAEATHVLGTNGVNVIGFSVAETVDFGIVRFIVDDIGRALTALKGARFMVHEGPVLVARVEDEPGGLARVLSAFADSGFNVDYSYAIMKCVLAFGVEEVTKAEEALASRDVELVSSGDLRPR